LHEKAGCIDASAIEAHQSTYSKNFEKKAIMGDMPEDQGPVDEAEQERQEEQKRQKRGTRKRRGSVSAPPTATIDTNLELRKFEKSPENLEFLKQTLAGNFIFSEVRGADQEALACAFEEMRQPAGYTVMKQGDAGDNYYVLRSGTVEIYVTPKDGGDPICVLTLTDKGYFGELALMYHAPRAASVICKTDCVLEALDGTSFHTILRRSGMNKRQEYHSFLREVPIMQNLEPSDIGKIADVLVRQEFKDGDHIIRQGDEDAETFYILYEGFARAILDKKDGPSMEVKRYEKGGYFGELALIKNVPRASNVVAIGDCVVVSIDRAAFVRLLGSQVEELRRGSAEYTTTGQIVTPGDKADPNDKLPITVPNEQEEVPKKKSSCCVVS